jgi:crotonobetainyl-CoA:carnitine CoA-transferase CaiB-like acyl-CoA transferase
MNGKASSPLAGIVVVELGHSVAAPAAGQILGDLGAEVVKVEKPKGDDARTWGPPFADGSSATFNAVNRNKRSVVCELRDEAQKSKLVDFIVAKADVVLQNLRPGQADALELGAKALLKKKPALVYCNVGAFGAKGPLAARPGYDALMQAFGGVMSVVGEEGRAPVRVGPSIIDVGTAMWAVIGILSALYRRRETGKGGRVDVSLFETSAAWMNMFAAHYLSSGALPKKHGSGQVGIVPYRAFKTSDGYVVISAASDAMFAKLCGVLGIDAHLDGKFRTNPDRVKNAEKLYGLIEKEMQRKSNEAWVAAFDAAGVPCAPVQDVAQMLTHEQTKALGLLQPVPGSSIPMIGCPISFDGERPLPRSAAPALGIDTGKILK